ncbi:hypothetical protein CDD83_3695 [Cordyceps sp. RAO-2017]|nr:hypothetical protein CDD83_3695 [Cordyceps sp. RAO-2017]
MLECQPDLIADKMSNRAADGDDVHRSLLSISAQDPTESITAQLVDTQRSRVAQSKSRSFLKELECLCFVEPRKRRRGHEAPSRPPYRLLRRTRLNAFKQPGYVALSYTWRPSPLETDVGTGGHRVEARDSGRPEPSPVRDGVLLRARRLMESLCVSHLWIDQHCIRQDDAAQKELGMQVMDRVYSLSDHPAALLARPVGSEAEMRLLTAILAGRLVRRADDGYRLSRGTTLDRAREAVELLRAVTSDAWFSRGWTFQENYRGGTKMLLLMPHARGLEHLKPHGLMRELDGELCIQSTRFHGEATKLCLAYQAHRPPAAGIRSCDDVIARAGRYQVLLQSPGGQPAPRSMSPTVIADVVGARELGAGWDRLPIIANCCQYSTRLDARALQARGRSLSVAILALYLLNGEILFNGPGGVDVRAARAAAVADFLKMHSYHGLRSPEPGNLLTFNKGCRFADVELTEAGVRTKGHLWRLQRPMPTRCLTEDSDCSWQADSDRVLTESSDSSSQCDRMLDPYELELLSRLVDQLHGTTRRDRFLAGRLKRFLHWAHSTGRHAALTFSQQWQVKTARYVAAAIGEGKPLRTARLLSDGPTAGCAVFVSEDGEATGVTRWTRSAATSASGSAPGQSEIVFTAYEEAVDFNDVDRHVSMVVESPDLGSPHGRHLPRLITNRWILGLCFFDGCPRQDVVFPWPSPLERLSV